MNDKTPDIATLITDPARLRREMAFITALRSLKVVTAAAGEIPLLYEEGSGNCVIDLRSLTPSGEPIVPEPEEANFPCARAVLTSAFNITTGGSIQTVNWSSVSYDQGPFWSAGNPNRLTATEDGVYMAIATVAFDTNGTGERFSYLRKNGTTTIGNDPQQALSTGATVCQSIGEVNLQAGEFLDVGAFQTSGGNLNIITAVSSFTMHLVNRA